MTLCAGDCKALHYAPSSHCGEVLCVFWGVVFKMQIMPLLTTDVYALRLGCCHAGSPWTKCLSTSRASSFNSFYSNNYPRNLFEYKKVVFLRHFITLLNKIYTLFYIYFEKPYKIVHLFLLFEENFIVLVQYSLGSLG